jgi:predicted Fe-Mo cluster-binding NifX family protein
MGKEKPVLAVASDGKTLKASVSHVAARCPYFLIVDDKGKLLKAVKNPYTDTKGRAGIAAADFLAQRKVTIVVAGYIGDKMRDALEAHEIVYFEFKGTVEQAIRKVLEKDGRT